VRPVTSQPVIWPHVHPLFWLLQGLNVLDGVLTELALDSGLATEGNPVVLTMGWPGKLAVVFVAGWLLALIRPKALVIPIVALAAVVVWTAAGLVLV
jgi:hypothetical protein